MRRFLLRWRNAFGRDGGRADLSRELLSHRALLEEEYQRRGMTAQEARLAARRADAVAIVVAIRRARGFHLTLSAVAGCGPA